jgi:hypothetical protein
MFWHSRTLRGQHICQFCRRFGINQCVRYAVASRKYTNSLDKGMSLLTKGGGGGKGENVIVESAPPRQSVVRLFFVCLREGFFLIFSRLTNIGGKLTAGPPTKK